MSDVVDQLLTRRTQQLRRWHLHPTNGQETLAEHQAQTARIAFEVALFCAHYCVPTDREKDPDPAACATAALYHDEAETMVSDVSAWFKNRNPKAREQIYEWEREAVDHLWDPYPEVVKYGLKEQALGLLLTEHEQQIVRYSDSLSALSFTRDEINRGNGHMEPVHTQLMATMVAFNWPWLEQLRRKVKDLP